MDTIFIQTHRHADTYNDHKYKFETEVKGDFNFQFIDDDYTPRAINCEECNTFHQCMNRIIANMESQTTSIRTPIPTTISTFQPTKRMLSENLNISKRFKQEVHTAKQTTPKSTVNKTSTSDDEYADVQLIATQQQHIRLESTPLTTQCKTMQYMQHNYQSQQY